MHGRTDVAWIHGLKSRDAETRADLWKLLFTYADSLAWRYDPDLVRDAALAAYQKILTRGIAQFAFRSSFKSYCKVIVAREINRLYERRAHDYEQHPGEIPFDEEIQMEAIEETIVPLPTTEAILDILRPCLPLLTEKERLILEQLYLQEHTPQQVADQFELTRNYVNVIASRVRKKMLECLKNRGFTTAEDCL